MKNKANEPENGKMLSVQEINFLQSQNEGLKTQNGDLQSTCNLQGKTIEEMAKTMVAIVEKCPSLNFINGVKTVEDNIEYYKQQALEELVKEQNLKAGGFAEKLENFHDNKFSERYFREKYQKALEEIAYRKHNILCDGCENDGKCYGSAERIHEIDTICKNQIIKFAHTALKAGK